MADRILVIDGAMGTSIQALKLDEGAFRGQRFIDHPISLQGNNDLLSLTRPDVIAAIHQSFADAGADLMSTNTFNATTISQADYATSHLAREINCKSARIASRRRCGDRAHPSKPGS